MNKRLRKICKILKYSLHLWPKERVIRRKFYGVEGFIFNPKKRIVKCSWISASWIGVYLSSGKFDAIVHDLDSLMELCTIWIVWSNCAQTLHVDDAQPSSYRERVEWGVIPHLKSTFIFLYKYLTVWKKNRSHPPLFCWPLNVSGWMTCMV